MQEPFVPSTMFLITPHDINSNYFIGLRANTDGTVKFRTLKGNDITLNVVAGEVITIHGDLVYATGTTAQVHGFGI